MNNSSSKDTLIDSILSSRTTEEERQNEPKFYGVSMYCNDPWEGSPEWIWIYREMRDKIETIVTNCDHIIELDDDGLNELFKKNNIKVLYTTKRVHDILWLANSEDYGYFILDDIDIFTLEQKGVKVIEI